MENAWTILSREAKAPKGVLTDEFVMKYAKELDWGLLSENYDFSIDMLRMYFHRVNWYAVLKRTKFDESFLREMAINFNECWYVVSKYQTLSESFIHDFAGNVDWYYIIKYQNVSKEFLEEHERNHGFNTRLLSSLLSMRSKE